MKFTSIQWDSELYDQEVQLRDAVLRIPLGLTFTPEQIAAEQNQLHFGVLDSNQLIGCVVGVPLSTTLIKIRQMAVLPERQRSGIGSFLIKNVEQALSGKGFHQIEMNARKVALGFYERLGYQIEGNEFIEVNIPHFKMTKQIG